MFYTSPKNIVIDGRVLVILEFANNFAKILKGSLRKLAPSKIFILKIECKKQKTAKVAY